MLPPAEKIPEAEAPLSKWSIDDLHLAFTRNQLISVKLPEWDHPLQGRLNGKDWDLYFIPEHPPEGVSSAHQVTFERMTQAIPELLCRCEVPEGFILPPVEYFDGAKELEAGFTDLWIQNIGAGEKVGFVLSTGRLIRRPDTEEIHHLSGSGEIQGTIFGSKGYKYIDRHGNVRDFAFRSLQLLGEQGLI